MYREGCVLIRKLVKRIHLQTHSYVGRIRFPYSYSFLTRLSASEVCSSYSLAFGSSDATHVGSSPPPALNLFHPSFDSLSHMLPECFFFFFLLLRTHNNIVLTRLVQDILF